MIVDALEITENTVVDYDICIVGAGAAGITLAKEFLDKSSYRVCLLESGGLEPDEDTQSLSKGEDVGFPYLKHMAYCRSFGGNTNLWSSWCRPLDEIDFEYRSWVPHSGWPFKKQELIPYYHRAQKVCQLGHFDNYVPANLIKDIGDAKLQLLPFNENLLVTTVWQITTPPLSFGKAYREEIKCAKNIYAYLHANVVDIETNDTGQSVTRVRVLCMNGKKFWVSSLFFILAMGGIENPRLLLASNKIQSAGLGNQHDIVGRFFMEHPHLHGSGSITISRQNHYPLLYAQESGKSYGVTVGLGISQELQKKEKLLNYTATLLPSPQPLTFPVLTMLEQAPDPNNRITLSREKDKLGVNRARLNLQLSLIHKRTILCSQQVIDKELRRAGIGQMKIDLCEDDQSWPPQILGNGGPLTGGDHQMGTTRMHIDPKQGVVDENCRVHGISNLYVAGSSVFSTGGSANPTLTIVALAIRLADHIKHIVKPRP